MLDSTVIEQQKALIERLEAMKRQQPVGVDGVVEDFTTMIKNLMDALLGRKPTTAKKTPEDDEIAKNEAYIKKLREEIAQMPEVPSVTPGGGGGGGGGQQYYPPPPPPQYTPPAPRAPIFTPVARMPITQAPQFQEQTIVTPSSVVTRPSEEPTPTTTGMPGRPSSPLITPAGQTPSTRSTPSTPTTLKSFSLSAKPKYRCEIHNMNFPDEASYKKHMADLKYHPPSRVMSAVHGLLGID